MLDFRYGRGAYGVVAALILSGSLVLGGCLPEGDGGDDNNGDVDAGTGDTGVGEDGGQDVADEEEIEVLGEYNLTFNAGEPGGPEDVTEEFWGIYELIEYDNEANWAVTRNPDELDFGPGTYNLNVWTEQGADGAFHYCTVDFGLATAEAAVTSEKTADDTALDTTGCGGFSWNKLTPR